MVPRYRVLVVDPLEETREVLRSALEPQGVRILATDRAARGLALAREHAPDVIVLDVEHLSDAATAAADFAAQSPRHAAPLLLIGAARGNAAPGATRIAKPYHYAGLIRKIEELLAAVPGTIARAA